MHRGPGRHRVSIFVQLAPLVLVLGCGAEMKASPPASDRPPEVDAGGSKPVTAGANPPVCSWNFESGDLAGFHHNEAAVGPRAPLTVSAAQFAEGGRSLAALPPPEGSEAATAFPGQDVRVPVCTPDLRGRKLSAAIFFEPVAEMNASEIPAALNIGVRVDPAGDMLEPMPAGYTYVTIGKWQRVSAQLGDDARFANVIELGVRALHYSKQWSGTTYFDDVRIE